MARPMSPATRSFPCIKALVPSSSPFTILSKVSRLTEIVQSAFFPLPSVTVFGDDFPSISTLPTSPKSNLSVPPSPEFAPIAGPIWEMICCTCVELILFFLPFALTGQSHLNVLSGARKQKTGGRPPGFRSLHALFRLSFRILLRHVCRRTTVRRPARFFRVTLLLRPLRNHDLHRDRLARAQPDRAHRLFDIPARGHGAVEVQQEQLRSEQLGIVSAFGQLAQRRQRRRRRVARDLGAQYAPH